MKNLSVVILIFLAVIIGCRSNGKSTFSSRMRTQRILRQMNEPKPGGTDASSGGSTTTAAPSDNPATAFAEFIAASKQAMATGDTGTVDQMYANTYIGTYDDGNPSTTKQDLLNHTKEDPSFISATVENARLLRHDSVQTQLSCDTVIKYASGTFTFRGVYTLVYQNGDWQIAAWRGSKITG